MNHESIRTSETKTLQVLKNGQGVCILRQRAYVMVLSPVPYIEPFALKVAVQSQPKDSPREKRDMQWFTALQLVNSLNRYKRNVKTEPRKHWKPFKVYPVNVWRPFEYIEENMQLFPRFRYTLLDNIHEFFQVCISHSFLKYTKPTIPIRKFTIVLR
eukprot:TRINITY_DN558_c0_g1_i3.p1 TRINITY_DN558_c0_g1~~TRINITY_DN558_c0_g1_i3.p1  ORF type:complete len:157 (-),score=23.16 TRINITY_DN558_c0_g1_i3:665-1135(-)